MKPTFKEFKDLGSKMIRKKQIILHYVFLGALIEGESGCKNTGPILFNYIFLFCIVMTQEIMVYVFQCLILLLD